ncbi:hypothetical protein [Xanthomonas rydalmerensis]|uniref:Uncharacterized protein n=1 Tax=Xanthomonas rydalmerensis TaxID=3046274 RepID=A0ABZ0JMW2_9XANT|nr:hypothetical protein [Xanthomonas sp. DM-2023]WOS41153.1 hypothetical protein QN243_01320 [Xanthomonas sp. DM-2023]WOS45338.1 hypothetical protein QN242_01320 [Xanthomonas sp. DM-2023]WOS49517.1 hypothetical protein QN240_01320 [Xanthomonas sp. DM-2023]WOS53697.1 hypothetical protein QN244_01320 [Xanthomonas sp. DM-2023]WOS57880.1 hypothetical protein QN245_01320 [Xanthomonas sp. DM-2023]
MKIVPNPNLPDATAQVVALVADALAAAVAPPGLQGVSAEQIGIETPHAILELALQDLADGRGLDSATRTGLRYLLRNPKAADAIAAVADVGIGRSNPAALWVKSLSHGAWSSRLASALARMAAYPAPETAGSVELALLRCRGVNVEALVALPTAGGHAMVFPFISAVPAVQGGAYRESAFFDALWPEARRAQRVFARSRPDEESFVG